MAVVPAGGLVRARNDCFIALDLDPGNFRLPLFAALLIALEKAHGRFSFFCQPYRDRYCRDMAGGL